MRQRSAGSNPVLRCYVPMSCRRHGGLLRPDVQDRNNKLRQFSVYTGLSNILIEDRKSNKPILYALLDYDDYSDVRKY